MTSQIAIVKNQISRDALAWCLAAQSICILPLFFYFPFWVPVLWFVAAVWRVQIYRGHWGYPPSFVKLFLGLSCIAGLWVTYRGGFGVEPVVAFLVCAFVLKLLEARTKKDVVIVLYVCFVAVAAQLLFNQTIVAAFYAIISLVVIIAAFTAVFSLVANRIKHRLFYASKLTLQALPLAVVLFLVLPRLGQLWAVPLNNASGTTGFSDSMAPGDISNLIRSSAVAFRASFTSSNEDVAEPVIPKQQDLYWRGLVLEDYDGRRWKRNRYQQAADFARSSSKEVTSEVVTAGEYVEYSILMEPHQQRWLFTLMAPEVLLNSTVSIGFKPQALLSANLPVTQRIQYQIRSAQKYSFQTEGLRRDELKRSLQVPEELNPRTKELVDSWLASGLTPQQIIEKALDLYRESFYYTLNPPPLGSDAIDEFLFITRRGFCEHFSSSFTYMMRLANIPARVVVGYQGGEQNSIENYLLVRQSDAHAWAEVWLEGQGWQRIDPTHVVAPNRIEQGLFNSVEEIEASQLEGRFVKQFALLNRLQMRWDSINYLWHSQVLAYDSNAQKSLFKRLLGGTEYWRIALALFGSVAVLLCMYFIAPMLRKGASQPAEVKLFNIFEKKLCKLGYTRLKSETAAQFVERIAKANPELAVPLFKVRDSFYAAAYQSSAENIAVGVKRLAAVLKVFPYSKVTPP